MTSRGQERPDGPTVRLAPGRWTALPGTGVAVRWDGEQEITVARAGGFWNLAALAEPGRVLAWARLVERPELGTWPVVAIGSGTIYRSRSRPDRYAGPGWSAGPSRNAGVRGYYLHVGASLLPRQRHGEPMTLAEALYRAHGLRYAVVYRLGEDGRPVPVVADAGNPGEVIHLPSGRRMGREKLVWHGVLNEAASGRSSSPRTARPTGQGCPG